MLPFHTCGRYLGGDSDGASRMRSTTLGRSRAASGIPDVFRSGFRYCGADRRLPVRLPIRDRGGASIGTVTSGDSEPHLGMGEWNTSGVRMPQLTVRLFFKGCSAQALDSIMCVRGASLGLHTAAPFHVKKPPPPSPPPSQPRRRKKKAAEGFLLPLFKKFPNSNF